MEFITEQIANAPLDTLLAPWALASAVVVAVVLLSGLGARLVDSAESAVSIWSSAGRLRSADSPRRLTRVATGAARRLRAHRLRP